MFWRQLLPLATAATAMLVQVDDSKYLAQSGGNYIVVDDKSSAGTEFDLDASNIVDSGAAWSVQSDNMITTGGEGLVISTSGSESKIVFFPNDALLAFFVCPSDGGSFLFVGSADGTDGGSTDPGGDPTDTGGDPTDTGGDPTDPGGEPTDPGGEPTDPVGGEPTDPVGGEPTDPVGGEPTDPVGGEPTDPVGGEPTDPVGGEPTDPVGGSCWWRAY
ncbi:CIC11C00000001254 [Sungouiella intermedia]|uniref:CIC11C00000001254 n=1 Tax=Sungouiella intermedia TaxID=45354 RepID=A0A1L0CV77_9ASCO|nr:CIC11C00000001254 [[Candida] intermedia]